MRKSDMHVHILSDKAVLHTFWVSYHFIPGLYEHGLDIFNGVTVL